jgi:hypothetical protein
MSAIAVGMTEGWGCEEHGYWATIDEELIFACECDNHTFFCVGCGAIEESADGKVYFYADERGTTQCVCYECVRGDNPNYVRLDLAGRPFPPLGCRVCRTDLPPGHIYCSRVCAMWDRREHLDDSGWSE